jgi:hypothetical protein
VLGTQQWNSLGGTLFIMAHLCIFHVIITAHPTYVFHSLANDTHIIGLASNVIIIYLRLQQELSTLGLLMQPSKCIVWFS